MTDVDRGPERGPEQDTTGPAWLASLSKYRTTIYIGGLAVMLIGFAGSFASFKAAAVRVGIDAPLFGERGPDLSHLVPLSVDVLALVASLIMVAPGIPRSTRGYALGVVFGAVGVSALANGYEHFMHAYRDLSTTPDPALWVGAIAIGLVFPVSMAFTMHLVLLVATGGKTTTSKATKTASKTSRGDSKRKPPAPARPAPKTPPPAPAPATAAEGKPDRAPDPTPAPATAPATAAAEGGTAEQRIRALVAEQLAAGTPFTALQGSALGRAVGTSGTTGRKVFNVIRTEHMTAYLDDQITQGRQVADVLAVELVDQFGGTEDAAAHVLDTYRADRARTLDPTTAA